MDTVLTPQTFFEITQGTKRLYLVGVINYRDAFGVPHVTEYRFEFGGARLIGMKKMMVSKSGNHAD
jgi:hypothetical protein